MFLTLLACVNLSGEWEGELECDTTDASFEVDVAFTLSPDNGDFAGDGTLNYSYNLDSLYTVDIEAEFEFELPKQLGPQDLEYEINPDDCEFFVAGIGIDGDCSAYTLDSYEIQWDGGNVMTVDPDNGDCDGEITRGG